MPPEKILMCGFWQKNAGMHLRDKRDHPGAHAAGIESVYEFRGPEGRLFKALPARQIM